MDEPTSARDEISKELLQNVLKKTVKKYGLTMIIVTHSIEEAVFLGHRIIVMGKGTIYKSLKNNVPDDRDERVKDSFFENCCNVRNCLKEVDAYEEKKAQSLFI